MPVAVVVDLDVQREAAAIRRTAPYWFLAQTTPEMIDRTAALIVEHRVRRGRIGMRKFAELLTGLRALGMTPLARAEARALGYVDGYDDDDGGPAA